MEDRLGGDRPRLHRGNGELLHPANATRRFIELYGEAGLPPVRLHDLRHGVAALAHADSADLKGI
ncbi:hypothetical protein ACIG0A_22070 [Streptomyces californicus]|uniref:hypothetical protein n=1 Tax=Streptomyces californicus TaxID=67351 RepID=UPI0037D25157